EQVSIAQLDVVTPTMSITVKPNRGDYHLAMKHLYLPAILKAKKGLKVKRAGVTVQVKSVELPVLIYGHTSNLEAKLKLDKLLESK
ncbi:MAG: hypothetical protein SOX43_04730, partial [Pelistega sp.]|nr:hypothetical protein [Pelistega sp.]